VSCDYGAKFRVKLHWNPAQISCALFRRFFSHFDIRIFIYKIVSPIGLSKNYLIIAKKVAHSAAHRNNFCIKKKLKLKIVIL